MGKSESIFVDPYYQGHSHWLGWSGFNWTTFFMSLLACLALPSLLSGFPCKALRTQLMLGHMLKLTRYG